MALPDLRPAQPTLYQRRPAELEFDFAVATLHHGHEYPCHFDQPQEPAITPTGPTLHELAADLDAGRTSARALVEECLARISDPAGEGARAFVRVGEQSAIEIADAMDHLRRAGAAPGPFAGIPLAIKDLFDVAGEVTTAGSKVLADAPRAKSDAACVARLRRAGFVFIGRSNMTEFAYSGLGLNPHYGTPLSVFDRAQGRVPGGSTSGGAVAVADGMAHAALGTDTGGSCRIPAAFNNLVGWKPTARRVGREGLLPLSTSLDSIGSMARSVTCCAILDGIIADQPTPSLEPSDIAGRRILVPTTRVLDDLDAHVGRAFEAALSRLAGAGVRLERAPFAELAELPELAANGGLLAIEAIAWHRALLAAKSDLYDPRVATRLRGGEKFGAADYIDLLNRRAGLIARTTARLRQYDAMVMPTVAVVPPRISDLASDVAYSATNLKVLRNTTLINLMDGCAVSLPISEPGAAPVGLMLASCGGADSHLLALAAAAESVLA
jgi:aspartyl-tRNA(Asn)/glutamyl-tRNA(Gln) amidotransferase subunit A